jgi:hypothetical protein
VVKLVRTIPFEKRSEGDTARRDSVVSIPQFSLKMYAATLVLSLLASVISLTGATTLNYKLEANEKACFYAQVEQTNAKVAFYFAVRRRPFFTCITEAFYL